MCGNATRCIGKYMYEHGLISKPEMTLETLSGIKILKMTEQDGKIASVRVDMGKAILKPSEIPTRYEGDTAVSVPLTVDGTEYAVTCVSMGNPHCVVFSENIDSVNIQKIGAEFENHPAFPDRINTEFVQPISASRIKMRVWERGAGETLSCGTGACAAAVACILNGYCKRDTDIKISLRGGELSVKWSADGDVYLTGPAQTVFTGEIAYGGGAR